MEQDTSSQIVFETDKWEPHTSSEQYKSATVQLLMHYSGGFIKNEKQAVRVFLALFICAILSSGYFLFFWKGVDQGVPSVPTQEDLFFMMQ